MCKNLPKCYEKGYCYFCEKVNCDYRVKNSGCNTKVIYTCNGNCYECKEAVRSSFYSKLYSLKGFGENYRGCLMYHYITEIQNFEFCGREGIVVKYSKLELAILQLKKCEKCLDRKTYYKELSEIASKIKEIPTCFESMTDLTQSKALSLAYGAITEVLEKEFECKTRIVLKRLIKEYLDLNKFEERINLDNICDYINSNSPYIDYYVHPLTVKVILDEML